MVARWLISDLSQLRTMQALQFAGATAIGAAVGALLGAWVVLKDISGGLDWLEYLQQWQIWWAGNWLGHLTLAPMIFCWLIPMRRLHPELALKSRAELALLAALLAVFSFYIFSNPQLGAESLLQMPMVILGLLIYCALRLPPRWVTVLFAMTALICTWFASRGFGPFEHPDVLERTGGVQTFLAAMAVISYALSMSTAEKRIVNGRLRDAERRYRRFLQLSTEAVWRIEIEQAMPVALSGAEQLQWLRRNARVVESNQAYQQLDKLPASGAPVPWKPELAWSAVLEASLPVGDGGTLSIDGLRFSIDDGGKRRHFVTSFYGVIQQGLLLRIWGVARDVTELSEVNERLRREQDRLKTYARQLVTTEEKARRATAMDLHDGIGQTLVGMAITLDVARRNAPPDVALLVDEVRARLRAVQDHTRKMITDLSPPGLYDLGLLPALQWLTVYMRGHDGLTVNLDAELREEYIKLDIRILAFKLVRELLRNVVKHAGVTRASVNVRGNDSELRVVVADHGKGFDSQLDLFGERAGGFGLWSVADRAREVGGKFAVESSPGRGSTFELVLPLGSQNEVTPAYGAGRDGPA